jgi:subfamily B ATP-binding cassette protein MsbA
MDTIKKTYSYFRKYIFFILLAIISSLIVAATQGATAYVIKPLMDGIFINKDKDFLLLMPVIVSAIFVIKGIFTFSQEFLMKYAAQRAIQEMRQDLFDNIIMLPLNFFSSNSTGALISRITNDVNLMQSSIPAAVGLMRDSVTLVVLTIVVFYQDSTLAIFALISFPFLGMLVINVGKRIKKFSRKGQEMMAELTSLLNEVFSGIRVIKAFVTETSEKAKFKERNAKLFRYAIKAIAASAISNPIMEVIGTVGFSLVIYFGGLKVINGETTPGTFFSFMAAVIFMYEPFKKINKNNHVIQSAFSAAERIFSIMQIKNEIAINDGYLDCDAKGNSITFVDVSFKYEKPGPYILKNINFDANPGEIIAIVGVSGSGKTTLVNLIPRFFDVTKGSICIGGIDIRTYKVHSLRKNIGFIHQDPFLFNDTIRNNICYGIDHVDKERLQMALSASCSDEFVNDLPFGLDTIIGERGIKLSGGQKQRITIARALIKNPPILIMDEATSSLDSESERIVQKALENLMKGRTNFVIAHRLSTILNASKIIVLDNGEINAIGTHSQLLTTSKTYALLYELQFAGSLATNERKMQNDKEIYV